MVRINTNGDRNFQLALLAQLHTEGFTWSNGDDLLKPDMFDDYYTAIEIFPDKKTLNRRRYNSELEYATLAELAEILGSEVKPPDRVIVDCGKDLFISQAVKRALHASGAKWVDNDSLMEVQFDKEEEGLELIKYGTGLVVMRNVTTGKTITFEQLCTMLSSKK